jgi:hypothetical protein
MELTGEAFGNQVNLNIAECQVLLSFQVNHAYYTDPKYFSLATGTHSHKLELRYRAI